MEHVVSGATFQMGSQLLLFVGAGFIAIGLVQLLAATQWFERKLEVIEHRWKVDHILYRHHLLTGSMMILGSIVFIMLLKNYDVLNVAPVSSRRQLELMLFLRLLGIASWVTAFVALLLGVVIVIRPSSIKPMERLANKWIVLFPQGHTFLRRTGWMLVVVGLACILVYFI